MAYISNNWCNFCAQYRTVLNGKCRECMDREFREKRAIWNSKTPEEKIEVLLQRIEKLEAGPPRY